MQPNPIVMIKRKRNDKKRKRNRKCMKKRK